ncbi:hypothetical protein J437_LFUL006949 [Ladona fulva]|uniref:Uncharacterized protein n=1 Tax=Ladona fulva TaxID=123851 RepID=A0A8K0KBF0_LADFU|nr:hypothetical protein J437_LFUL006949 [Ladona fulva]
MKKHPNCEEETVSFIDLPPNNLPKLPEKGILKKPGPYGTVEPKEKWSEDSQSDNQEVMSQSDNNLESDGGGSRSISDMERTLKSLNGYHEDILEALRNAASHRAGGPSGSAMSVIGEELRKSLCDVGGGGIGVAGGAVMPGCYSDYGTEFPPLLKSSDERLGGRGGGDMGGATGMSAEEEAVQSMPGSGSGGVPPCGPIRIRNLEDLIRQLEHHSPSSTAAARRMSPSGSEDIRMSETEADRHYRLDSSSGCPDSQRYAHISIS